MGGRCWTTRMGCDVESTIALTSIRKIDEAKTILKYLAHVSKSIHRCTAAISITQGLVSSVQKQALERRMVNIRSRPFHPSPYSLSLRV